MKQKNKNAKRTLAAFLALSITAASLPLDTMALTAQAQENGSPSAPENARTVSSPGNRTSAAFWLDGNGTPMYSIYYGDKQVVEESAMGFDLQVGDEPITLDHGFTLEEAVTASQDSSWENPFGDLKTVPDRYEELTLHYVTEADISVDVICRAYDEGVAFCYSFPEDKEIGSFTINQELTYFNLDDTATAYVHQNRNQTEVIKTPVTDLEAVKNGYFRPLTVIGEGYAMSITEASQIDYTRVHFTVAKDSAPGTLRTVFNGTSDNVDLNEANVKDEVTADISEGAFRTSWRTFILGNDEGNLVDHNYLVKNLNPACALKDTSWITPGMAIRAGLTTEAAKSAIDFASKHGYAYVHFDAGWYGPEGNGNSDPWTCIDGFDLDEISAYADEHGIRLMVYINYRHLESQYTKGTLSDLFQMYKEEWGIDGIKFGFVPVGSQASTKMVYEWVKIAADNEMIVDIHDEMLTTGYDRTYPNLLTYEAIHGDEENPTPTDDLGYLFTRMTAGQADHTWCFSRGDRNTTKAFRVAASLVYFSPLIFPHWYDDGSKGTCSMWDSMPTTWDESHMLDSKIEKYAVMSRRSGEDWYLSGISASDYELSIPLTMLEDDKTYRAEIYTNDPSNVKNIAVLSCLTDSADTLTARLTSNYGYAVKLTPVKEGEDVSGLTDYSAADSVSARIREEIASLPPVTTYNLKEIQEKTRAIRSTYDSLSTLEKTGISNFYLLEDAEEEMERMLTTPMKSLFLNGEELDGFSPDTESYSVLLTGSEPVPQISCEVYGESRIVEIHQAESLPGHASVTVKNPFVTKTYTINFTIPTGTPEIYASDYADYTADGRKEYKKDTNRSGGPLTLYNASGEVETFQKGIGTHAATNIYYNVEGLGATRFQAYCGVSSANGNETTVLGFKVYKVTDGVRTELFDSGDMSQKTPYKAIDVDIAGASQVILEANIGSDGKNSNDHANWCDAKFILGEAISTLPIDEMTAKADKLLESTTNDSQRAALSQAVADAEAAKNIGSLDYPAACRQIYAAAMALRNTILDIRQQQNEELQTLVNLYGAREQGDIPTGTWEECLAVLNTAKLILQDIDATKEQTAEAYEALRSKAAILNTKITETPDLTVIPPVKGSQSAQAYAYANGTNLPYTVSIVWKVNGEAAGSIFAPDTAYTAVITLTANDGYCFDETALPTQISVEDQTLPLSEEAASLTDDALGMTVSYTFEPTEKDASAALLTAVVNAYAALDLSAYTKDSAAAFRTALEKAEDTLTNDTSNASDRESAASGLLAAAAALVPDTSDLENALKTAQDTAEAAQTAANAAQDAADKAAKELEKANNTLETQAEKLKELEKAAADARKIAEEAQKAADEAKAALANISHKEPQPSETPALRKGQEASDGTYTYKVTGSSPLTVELTGATNAGLTKIVVPASVTLSGQNCLVTSIAASAFKNQKKAVSAILGKNIKIIGANAFAGCTKLTKVTVKSTKLKQIGNSAFKGCKKLKTITLKSKSLSKVGKNAFKGISSKAVIKVPASKLKAYTKLLSKKGQRASVKIKK